MSGNRVIIWGVGGVGKSSKDYLRMQGEEVLFFVDNNSSLWGETVDDTIVISPKEINNYDYDYIVLGTFKSRNEITNQLKSIGVDESKIISVIEQRKAFKLPGKYSEDELVKLHEKNFFSNSQKEYDSWNINIFDSGLEAVINDIKKSCIKYNIPVEKICVVKGLVMVAHGLRDCKKGENIDIIATSDICKLYGTGKVYLEGKIEINPLNFLNGRLNDDIINDPEKHIVCGGIKFLSLVELYKCKTEQRLINTHNKELVEEIFIIGKYLKEKGVIGELFSNDYASYRNLPVKN